MTPTLEFLERNPGMLAEMITDFQQRKKMIDVAKTKEPVDANVIENPNLRAGIPYPRLMYSHTRRTTLEVQNYDEHQAALHTGWSEKPWGSVDAGVPAGPQSTADPMTDERMDSLEQRMLALEQGMAEVLEAVRERRKPGRPPNNPQG